MAEHTATLVIERDRARVKFVCHCAEDAQCHQQVADYSLCHCETYSAQQLPDGSWGHIVYRDDVHEFRPMDSGVDTCKECDEMPSHEVHTADEEVWHPMKPGRECNYLTWIEADCSAEELYCGDDGVSLVDTPVEFIWAEGDHYEWLPVASPRKPTR